MKPQGSGPAVIAGLAQRKLETAIRRKDANVNVNVGVLAANPRSSKTEDPLAVVCDFADRISEEVLRETHRLAWSFSRSPMLITVEPNLIGVWTCWKRPLEENEDVRKLRVEHLEGSLFEKCSLSSQAAKTLQWVELASGSFFRKPAYSKYFQRDQRADQLMLEDLRGVRQRLLDMKLPEDICHDLLARVIFIEFLFQRKDSQGNSALNENILASLREKGVLSKVHKDLASVLLSHGETYRFFRELDDRFNGDLFPGKGDTTEGREREWKAEMDEVKVKHLKLLAEFVRGEMDMGTRQLCLWKKYAFDVIPLEFVSSIYEEFVSKKKGKIASGVHYTPMHVVDLVLDSVLPWDSTDWDMKILDPACGSGIFLVKAYQRLIHRWKNAHQPDGKPRAQELRSLLENNLLGVDIDPHAVRVASFSLYLAMCDELEPKHVWRNVNFPRLRDRRLIESDFFAEDKQGFQTDKDRETYDLIVGNAPWGRGSANASNCAKRWASRDSQNIWSIPNLNIGPLFLVKAAGLVKDCGRIGLLQPAGALLFNQDRTAKDFRRQFFSTYKVDQIINLAALRLILFPRSNSPACAVTMLGTPPDGEPITYVFPKRSHTKEDRYRIVIEQQDVSEVYVHEASDDPLAWSTLAWGGRRDLLLMRRLCQQRNLEKLREEQIVKARRGVGRGARVERQEQILNMRLFDAKSFPAEAVVHLDARQLSPNLDPFVYEGHSTKMDAFKLPQMILKLSWRREDRRFRALIVDSNDKVGPVLCSFSYVSVHVPAEYYDILESAYLAMNSKMAVYYTLLSSGQFAFYIPKPTQDDLLRVPIPSRKLTELGEIENIEDVDDAVKRGFKFKDAEWVLIEDLFDYTLPDFKGGMNSPGRQPTRLVHGKQEVQGRKALLMAYCEYFCRVLRAGFGQDKQISATIFTEGSQALLPVRLVAIHLDAPGKALIRMERIDSPELIERLKELDSKFLKSTNRPADGGIFYQRVARIYDNMLINGREVPTVFIVKPDQVRYWTRSMALRDADEVAGDIMLWQDESGSE
ncbi:MAG: HsdM family class I SAM-dependent methyltransferase [Planctomycetota bacterium]|jgi:hypothetical protein